MAESKRTAELVISLIDRVSTPAHKAHSAIRSLITDLDRASRVGTRAAARFSAGLDQGFGPVAGSLSPNGKHGAAMVDGANRTGAALSRSAATHAALAANSYDGVFGSALATAKAIAPFMAALGVGKGISTAADFESSLTEIEKKSGASADEITRVGEEIKALAVSGRVASSIEEIAAAYARGAAAGIPISELATFAELSVKAADGFEMSAEAVGNFSAKLTTSLGMNEEQVRRTFDLINSLADAGIADEKDLVDFQDRTGATLKTLGLANEQGLALGATMLNIGMRSEVAATASGALASRLLTVGTLTGKAKKSFERVMGPVGKFAGMVEEDANGALLALLDRLQELPAAQKAAFLKDFVGAEWADEMIRLSEATGEFRRNLRMASNEASWLGSLDASYQLKLDDFWSQWRIVQNAVQKLVINFATPGMPALKAGMEDLVRLTNEIDRGFQSFKVELDISEMTQAKDAVASLTSELTGLMGMGATVEGTAIERWFSRLAATANGVAGAVNVVKDAGQALGLLQPDEDTPEVRRERRAKLLQDYRKFNPHIFRPFDAAADWFNEPDRAAERNAANARALEQARTRNEAIRSRQRPGAGDVAAVQATNQHRADKAAAMPLPEPAPRSPRVRQSPVDRFEAAPVPEIDGLTASIDALASALGRRSVAGPDNSIRVPTPTPAPRPEIVAPLVIEGAEADAKAAAIAARLVDVLSIVAKPTVDVSSITAAISKVNALDRAFRNLPGTLFGSSMPLAIQRSGGSVLSGDFATGALPRKASGGAVMRGPYLVGERGPEVVHMGRNGYVTPNHRMPAPSTGPISINIYGATNPQATADAVGRRLDRLVSRSDQTSLTW